MRRPHLWILAAAVLLATAWAFGSETVSAKNWAAFEMSELSGQPYLSFLDVPAMSAGVYELTAGATDRQRPHGRDEIYYVVEGKARFAVDGKDIAVAPGAVLYVKAGIDHRFHSIEEDLKILVVFAGPSDS